MAALPTAPKTSFGAALTYVQNLLGYLLQEQDETFAVAITNPTAPFVGQNGDRVGLLIANIGANTVFISLSATIIGSGNGFLLPSNGGAIAFDARTDFTLPTRAWFAVAQTAPSTLYVIELIGWKALPPGSVPGSV